MAKKIYLNNVIGKILNDLEKKDITCPIFMMTDDERKQAVDIYENSKLWPQIIDERLELASELWEEVLKECSNTKQNQNNFAFVASKAFHDDLDSAISNSPEAVALKILGDLEPDLLRMVFLLMERIVTDNFGRPRREEDPMEIILQKEITDEIEDTIKKVCKKARKKNKKKK